MRVVCVHRRVDPTGPEQRPRLEERSVPASGAFLVCLFVGVFFLHGTGLIDIGIDISLCPCDKTGYPAPPGV